MRLSVADAGPVRVRVGDTLELALPETAATGYRWRFTSGLPVLLNVYVAAPDSPDALAAPHAPGTPGTAPTPDAAGMPRAAGSPDAAGAPHAAPTPDTAPAPDAAPTPPTPGTPDTTAAADALDTAGTADAAGPFGPPGRSGERRVVFGVTAAGRHELRAELARPWENAPRDTIVFVVEAGS